ncbi:MAG: transcription-repair coupling factor, partial [Planctomycetota bacterium]|nr:transcription-repair coupling factor [Planctomycetota bacterium]
PADPAAVRARLQLAGLMAGAPGERPSVVVASLLSCLQPLPSGQRLGEEFIHLNVGAKLDAEATVERLVNAGYTRQPLAEAPGELSLRGDILDLFPFASEEPLRIELFDDEVEALRLFDPDSQRSTQALERVSVCVASDAGDIEAGRGRRIDELLGKGAILVEVEPLRIADTAEGLRIQSSSHGKALIDWHASRDGRARLELGALPGSDRTFEVRSVQGLAVGVREAAKALGEALDRATAVDPKGPEPRAIVLAANPTELERMQRAFVEDERVEPCLGSLGRGFQLKSPPLFVVNHRELIGIEGTRRAAGARAGRGIHKARALQSFFELKLGDLVVHAVHGLGRYLGLKRMTRGEGEEEHLCIEYQDEVQLFVPASKVDLVQRYISSGSSSAVTLDRIGAKSFARRKERVEKAVADLAAELLEVQAKREMRERTPWIRDDETRALVREMVDEFPYQDTPDQGLTDSEVAEDLTGRRPMDRLLCGDVGFGKTEIAIRAAFRVVAGGGQAAVLVPTTVLAAQHYRTFAARLADFPVRVEVLSRYVTGKKAKEIVAAATRGEVDILIGTHRILSKDVAMPKLGILIIDEEQRFGVTHKEHFKKLRSEVDILTLSATPIPRTLHMSMSGLRDISALTTPPPGRQDIETILAASDDKQVVREALLREHNRGGQSFFLHNRVQSIDRVAYELAQLVPECTFAVGHGQMSGKAIEAVMGQFIRGEVDVLVATTIVENGIDVPLAGTILMDRAGHFGLSELHQLRGRVGRGSHKAYCYLLTDSKKPLSDIAQERLKALEELNHLGSGFAISMKDLELRGAGNLLGPEQSGHITAVGYDLYCRLLKKTVDRLQRGGSGAALPDERPEPSEIELELGIDAFLPDSWIPSADTRLELLRSLDAIRTDEDATEALGMLADRFGRVPPEAAELVAQFRFRQLVADAGLTRLSWRDGMWLVEYRDRALLEAAFAASGAIPELRPQGRGRALLMAPAGLDLAQSRRWIEALLRGEPKAARMSAAARIR